MQVKIYTDGAARGNPDGPGGYGAVLQYIDTKGQLHERELSRGYKKTTNNRMELMAAIVALEALNRPCQVDLSKEKLETWKKRRCEERRSLETPFKGQGAASGKLPLG